MDLKITICVKEHYRFQQCWVIRFACYRRSLRFWQDHIAVTSPISQITRLLIGNPKACTLNSIICTHFNAGVSYSCWLAKARVQDVVSVNVKKSSLPDPRKLGFIIAFSSFPLFVIHIWDFTEASLHAHSLSIGMSTAEEENISAQEKRVLNEDIRLDFKTLSNCHWWKTKKDHHWKVWELKSSQPWFGLQVFSER